MNANETNPITGPGILWAIGQINKRFEQAAPKTADENTESPFCPLTDENQCNPLMTPNPL